MGIFVIGIGDSQKKSTPLPPSVVSQSDSGSNRSFDDGAAYITFNDTIFNGKLPIIDYLVTAVSETNDTLSFTINSIAPFVATGLKSGVKYRYKIKARNALGYSSDSSETGLNTATTVPGRPTSLGVVDVRNGGSLDLGWIAPANGGAAIKGYIITPSLGSTIDTGSSATSYRYSGVVGTPVSFTVAAYNDNGTGQASTVSIAVTPSSAPVTTTTTTTTSGGGGTGGGCSQSDYTTSISGGTTVTITGKFNTPVTNISWNGTNIPVNSWTQSNTTLTFSRPTASSASVQVFNGCIPVMSSLSYTLPPDPVCTIPSNIIGSTTASATTALQNAGYVVQTGTPTTTSTQSLDGTVRAYTSTGTACGSTVTLTSYAYQAVADPVVCNSSYGTVIAGTYSVGFGPLPTACSGTGSTSYQHAFYKCSDGTTQGGSGFAICSTPVTTSTTTTTTAQSCPGTYTNWTSMSCADLGLTTIWISGSLACCGTSGGGTTTSTTAATTTTTSTTSTTSTTTSTTIFCDDVPCCSCTTCCGGAGGYRLRNTCSGTTSSVICYGGGGTTTSTTAATTSTSAATTSTAATTTTAATTSVRTTATTSAVTTSSSTACLVGSTLISTPKGFVKAEDIKVGDEVHSVRFAELSTDETIDTIGNWNSRALTPIYTTLTVIKNILVKEERPFYINLNGDKMTPEHPVLVRVDGVHRFMEAGDVAIGYEVLKRVGPNLSDLVWTPVTMNSFHEERVMVYLFDAEEDDVIFTENMLTHNIKCLRCLL